MDILPTTNNRTFRKNSFRSYVLSGKRIATKESGFTLLELLAVVVIIGIVISIASLSIGQKSSHVVQDEAQRLNALLRLAGEESVMQGRELAIQFSRTAYSFLELSADNQWLPIGEDELFRERTFPPGMEIDLTIEGATASFEDEKNLPRIFILSSGELTSFTLNLGLDKETYILTGDIDGRLTLTKANENDA